MAKFESTKIDPNAKYKVVSGYFVRVAEILGKDVVRFVWKKNDELYLVEQDLVKNWKTTKPVCFAR